MSIEQSDVTHVYLRKPGDLSHAGDDAWRLSSVFVYLIADVDGVSRLRSFSSRGPAWLGNEHGSQVWLAENFLGSAELLTREGSLETAAR